MQRLGLSATRHSCCAWTRCRYGRSSVQRRRVLKAKQHSRMFSATNDGGDYDDFWTEATKEAASTPAYKAADVLPPANIQGVDWANSAAADDAPTHHRPAGAAYGPYDGQAASSTTQNNPSEYSEYQPLFDLSSPLHLSDDKQITVSDFKGVRLVNIRTYFRKDDGTIRPTKKGAALTLRQWQRLKEAVDSVDKAIRDLDGHHQ